ncbi:unnamed protein product [Adineta steineri]|uniref:Terpene synthase n=2 Tax=Adineta steineri TaxID=433720 RepID=A0A814TQD8_9BILA|nr:unnamed protein product [Adineta steineri]
MANMNDILLPDLIGACPFKPECNPVYEPTSNATEAWLNSHGIRYKESIHKYSLASALCVPQCNPTKARDASDIWALLFSVDDIIDTVPISEHIEQSKKQLAKNIMESFQPAGSFKPLTPFAAALHDWWQRILVNITPGCRERFLTGYQTAYKASLVQAANKRDHRIVPDLNTYIKFRRDTAFGPHVFVFIEYCLELDSLDECWNNDVFKRLVDYASDATSWTNDIYSFNIEQAKGDSNLISVLMHADPSLNIQQAFDRGGQMVIDCYADFQRARKELISWGTKIDSQVEKFVNGAAAFIIGNARSSKENTTEDVSPQ